MAAGAGPLAGRAGAAVGLAASTTLTDGAAAGSAGFSAAVAAASSGLPALAARALCRAANGIRPAGGAVCATTCLRCASSGGLDPAAPPGPITLACTGATGATATERALAMRCVSMRTSSRPTGRDWVKAAASTATTAPATFWLA